MSQNQRPSDRTPSSIPPRIDDDEVNETKSEEAITDIHDRRHPQYLNHNHGVVAPPPLQRLRIQDETTNEPRSIPVPPPAPLLVDDALPSHIEASEAKQIDAIDPSRTAMSRSLPETATNSSSNKPKPPTVFNDYESYLKILQKIEVKVGSKNAGCFQWTEDSPVSPNGSVICKACEGLISYNGYWTTLKPIRNYNLYKFLCHIKSTRHRKAVTHDEMMEIERFAPTNRDEIISEQISLFKALINKFHLILFYAHKNYPFRGLHDLTLFIEHKGGCMDSQYYSSYGGAREMLGSLAAIQEAADYDILRAMCDRYGFWLSLDGQKRAGLSLKVFGIRGIPGRGQIVTERFVDILPMNKGKLRPYGISDGLTINSGVDQLYLVDEIMQKAGRSYRALLGISSDGDLATLGRHNGLIAQIQKERNKSCVAFSAVCHRTNHVLMRPFLRLEYLKVHVQSLKEISSLLHDSVPAQILAAIQDLDDVSSGSVKKPYESRWNYMFEPMVDVNDNLVQILKTLAYMKENRERREERERCRKNWKYYSSIEKIVINQVAAAISMHGDDLMKKLSSRNIDKISAFVYLYEYVELMALYVNHGIVSNNDYIKDAKSEFVYKESVQNGQAVHKLTRGGFEWTLECDQVTLDGYYNKIGKEMAQQILQAYNARFSVFEKVTYKKFIAAIDPQSFAKFDRFAAVKTYGNAALLEAVNAKQELRNTNNQRMYVYNGNVILSQYEMSKKELFRLRNSYPAHLRIREYFMFLVSKEHLFRDLVHFLKDEFFANGATVELERCFSARSWMQGKSRNGMSWQLIRDLMRIMKNGPNPDESESTKKFLLEAALHWYSSKNRNIKCELFDDLKVRIDETSKEDAIDEFVEFYLD